MSIYLNGKIDFRRTVPLLINPAYFNNETGKVRKLSEFHEKDKITIDLKELSNHILKKYNSSIVNGDSINSFWLKNRIDEFFGMTKELNLEFLLNYSQNFIENLRYKVNRRTHRRGVSIGTEKSYKTIKRKIEDFESYTNQKLLLKDVDIVLANNSSDYLKEVQNLSENTIGKYIKLLKSICLDAQKMVMRWQIIFEM
ncbi:hypothetical protein BUL40_10375 [Croceivirga radicis]|uniref:Phage integrase SAM-like domain-containing protein n=1 Tax=Croceivirga radicis TaxID=1929488 RepID=A0A1V6LR55_9FLAO|nr:phage integrase SAM-like domain-containing protein [Croceivirga radicis]OQD42517.1 hypothetical protein BUL40_10375 [Croceivirga radicis]